MQKKYVPILAVLLVTLGIAAAGYFMPQEATGDEPVRVLLENVGGTVVFDHQTPTYYGFACVDCHHELEADPSAPVMACGECHGIDYSDPNFIGDHLATFTTDAQCVTCHHYQFEDSDPSTDFHHDLLTRNMDNCLACHNEPTSSEKLVSGEEFYFDFMQASCSNCHDEAANDLIPSRMDAFHTSCMDCHEMMGVGPYMDDQCAQCHG